MAPGTRIVNQKAAITWTMPRPAHDVHLVAIATGPGVTEPCWAIPRPYQPTSMVWQPRVIGSTNPIWIDADGDGVYTAPRAYAVKLLAETGPDPKKLLPALESYDQAVAIQAAALCHAAGQNVQSSEWMPLLRKSSEPTRQGFAAFAHSLANP